MAKKIMTTIYDKNDEVINQMVWSNRNDAKAFMFDLMIEGQKTGQYEIYPFKKFDSTYYEEYGIWNYGE